MGFWECDLIVEGDGDELSPGVFLPLLDEFNVNIVEDGRGGAILDLRHGAGRVPLYCVANWVLS